MLTDHQYNNINVFVTLIILSIAVPYVYACMLYCSYSINNEKIRSHDDVEDFNGSDFVIRLRGYNLLRKYIYC